MAWEVQAAAQGVGIIISGISQSSDAEFVRVEKGRTIFWLEFSMSPLES